MPPVARPPAERFWAKVQLGDGCWLWTGALDPQGYGRFKKDTANHAVLAHRFAYELLVGPIGELTLDHLCRVRNCVRPEHLEPVALAENIRRGDHAKPKGKRRCSIEGCDNRHFGHDLCRPHLRRLQKHGNPLAGRPLRAA